MRWTSLSPFVLTCCLFAAAADRAAAQTEPSEARMRQLVLAELRALNAEIARALGRLANESSGLDAAPTPAPVDGAPRLVAAVAFRNGAVGIAPAERERVVGAASAIRQLGTSRVKVIGFADRTGSPAANSRLAQRRADAVAELILAAGFTADDVEALSGIEANWPLPVPTAEGVVEPRNRVAHVFASD
ncbi:MAG: OmpA family protein [Pseudomonadota bacterium]